MLIDVGYGFFWLAEVVLLCYLRAWLIGKVTLDVVTRCRIRLHRFVKFACNIDITNEDDTHCVATSFTIKLDTLP